MKVKKRYLAACILMCIAALALSVAVFYFEMGLARYSKLNRVVRDNWIETSASDPETGINTDLFVTKVLSKDEADEVKTWSYIGNQSVVDGKYVAYGKDVFGSSIVINGDIKMGDRITVYYKPDNPTMVYCPVSYTMYIIFLAVCIVIAAGLIVACRLINKHMKENTFSDAAVTFMDIPMAVIVAGVVLGFFAGMFIGSIQVDSNYTSISHGMAEMYANHEYQF